jgi:hypothetical protein
VRPHFLLLIVPLAGCGPRVQDADVRAPTVAMAPVFDDAPAVAGTRFVVTPARTRLEIHGWGPIVGEQVFTFRRFRANVTTDGGGARSAERLESRLGGVGGRSPPTVRTATFRAELDVTSLEGGISGLDSFARDHMLEADLHPRATFIGTVRRHGTSDACSVSGLLALHGVTREIAFEGIVREEGDSIRFAAVFDLPRKEFDVRLHNAWDAFVPNDVRIVLDVRAEREHVFVEEL